MVKNALRIGTEVNRLEFERDLWSRQFTLVAGAFLNQ